MTAENRLIKRYHGEVDLSKPKILVLTGCDVYSTGMNLDCWFSFVAEYWISKGYQVVFIGPKQSKESADIVSLGLNTTGFRSECYRSQDHPDSKTINQELAKSIVNDELLKPSNGFSRIAILGGKGHFILPLQPFVSSKVNRELNVRQNEFHDDIHDGTVENHSQEVAGSLFNRVSATGYSTVHTYVYFSLVREVMESCPECIVDKFIIDPSTFYPYFTHQFPDRVNLWYFADDQRGQRDFEFFPMGELLHCVFERTVNPMEAFFQDGKDRLFFFAGSVIYDKGDRPEKYKRFLEPLRISNSSLFIPLRQNGVNQSYRENDSQTSIAEKKHKELVQSIKQHPLWKPAILPSELQAVEPRYKYSLILKCVAQTDSLNFRPVNYAKDRVLPLLDPEYDPECLQIHNELQDKLVVRNSDDIQERVQWFENNPDEREEIIDQLRELFNVDWWLSADQTQINRVLDVYFSSKM